MPNRRTFLITCGGAIAVPAVAQFALPPSAKALPSLPSAGLPTVALRIHGWDSATGSADDVWLQVSTSWRANWR